MASLLVLAVLLTLLYFTAIFALFSYVGPVLHALAPMTVSQVSMMLLVVGLAGVVGTLVGGWANDRSGPVLTLKMQLLHRSVLQTAMPASNIKISIAGRSRSAIRKSLINLSEDAGVPQVVLTKVTTKLPPVDGHDLSDAHSIAHLSENKPTINWRNHILAGSRLYFACQKRLIANSGNLIGSGDVTRSKGPSHLSANRSGTVAMRSEL